MEALGLGSGMGLKALALAVVAGVLLWLFMRASDARARRKNDAHTAGRVIGFVGQMGTGKTYTAVSIAHRRLQAGANVWTNFKLNLPAEYADRWFQFRTWHDIIEAEDAVIIIDEAHLLAPSGRMDFPMAAKSKLSQARSYGLDLYWISQHESRVNKQLRDLTNFIFKCEQTLGGKGFKAKAFEMENLRRKSAKPLYVRRVKRTKTIDALYNTLEILDFDDLVESEDVEVAERMRAARDRRNDKTTGARASGGPSSDVLARLNGQPIDT